MKSILLSIALFTLARCSQLVEYRKSKDCEIYDVIFKGWTFDQEKSIFKFAQQGVNFEMELIRHQDCFNGLSRRSIFKLFGVPSVEKPNSLGYFLSTACNGVNGVGSDGCYQLEVLLSADGKSVREVNVIAAISSP
jgi:hypothetical protein